MRVCVSLTHLLRHVKYSGEPSAPFLHLTMEAHTHTHSYTPAHPVVLNIGRAKVELSWETVSDSDEEDSGKDRQIETVFV